jgi:AcrR family transcriptional regulator
MTVPTPSGTRDVPRHGGTGARSAQRDATRARLFAETVEEFKRRGFAETEIAVIAERVGVSRGAFYVHFSGKDEVLRELLLIEERRIAAAVSRVDGPEVPLGAVLRAIVDAVLRAERRLGRRLVRDLCAGQFRPPVSQGQAVDEHPVGVMLVEVLTERAPGVDAVDLAMTFLTGLFGLLATDDAPLPARRRRLDLLVRLAAAAPTP